MSALIVVVLAASMAYATVTDAAVLARYLHAEACLLVAKQWAASWRSAAATATLVAMVGLAVAAVRGDPARRRRPWLRDGAALLITLAVLWRAQTAGYLGAAAPWALTIAATAIVVAATAAGRLLRPAGGAPSRTAAIWVAAFALVQAAPSVARWWTPERPNLVWIMVDGLRADALGAYGATPSPSPAIDALAARGLRVHQAVTPAPSRPLAAAAALHSWRPVWPADFEQPLAAVAGRWSLPEVLAARGYETFGVLPSDLSALWPPLANRRVLEPAGTQSVVYEPPYAKRAAEAAVTWLSQDARAPYFLFVYLDGPSVPIRGYPEDLGDLSYEGRIYARGDSGEAVRHYARTITATDRAFLSRLYDSEVRRVDAAVGRIVAALSATGGDTVIVLSGDRGTALAERVPAWIGDEAGVAAEYVRVPLVMVAPGGKVGSLVTRPLSLLDVMPSVLAAVDVEMPSGGVPAGTAYPFHVAGPSPATAPPVAAEARFGTVWQRALYAGRWKLVRDLVDHRARLYDVVADPAETTDVRDAYPDVAAQLNESLVFWAAGPDVKTRWLLDDELPP